MVSKQAAKYASSAGPLCALQRSDVHDRSLVPSIHSYDGRTARLILRDRYPATAKDVPTVIVNVEHVLETLRHDLLETGAWLNIMGYVRPCPDAADAKAHTKPKRTKRKAAQQPAYVEATMIRSAGAIKLDKYDAAITELQQASDKTG